MLGTDHAQIHHYRIPYSTFPNFKMETCSLENGQIDLKGNTSIRCFSLFSYLLLASNGGQLF